MQDRYSADIGEFGKCALLRALVAPTLRLGVVWYMNPDEEGNRDGEFVRYPELRECDENLYNKLQMLLSAGTRRIAALEEADVLPADTTYFAQPLTFHDLPPFNLSARRRRREQWLQGAVAAMSEADLVFLDPDNGFAPNSVSATSNGAQKYVFVEEILAFLNRNQSMVIYHHHARNESLRSQIECHFQGLRASGAHHLWALTFHRRSVRVFFIVAASRHSALLLDRSREFAATLWGQRGHFQFRAPINEGSRTTIAQTTKSSTSASSKAVLGTPRSEICEIREGQRWNIVGIAEALEIRRQHGRWPGGRCVECHEPVRPHKLGITGQRGHFEHLDRNPRCSRSDK